MTSVFVVVYYNVDEVKNSEVIGVYKEKKQAIDALLKAAHYDDKDGVLRQYRVITKDYESFGKLCEKVSTEMELVDFDIYRIEEIRG
jgi:hypothetical protein